MGRGISFFLCALTFFCCAPTIGFSVPQSRIIDTIPDQAVHPGIDLLCQETQPETIDFNSYFSVPEIKEDLVYVFYKSEIAVDDTVQAGYALLYGFEYASANAQANELLAVVIYFDNKKAKIYSIRKQAFDQLQNNKIRPDELEKYLKVEVKDTP